MLRLGPGFFGLSFLLFFSLDHVELVAISGYGTTDYDFGKCGKGDTRTRIHTAVDGVDNGVWAWRGPRAAPVNRHPSTLILYIEAIEPANPARRLMHGPGWRA